MQPGYQKDKHALLARLGRIEGQVRGADVDDAAVRDAVVAAGYRVVP